MFDISILIDSDNADVDAAWQATMRRKARRLIANGTATYDRTRVLSRWNGSGPSGVAPVVPGLRGIDPNDYSTANTRRIVRALAEQVRYLAACGNAVLPFGATALEGSLRSAIAAEGRAERRRKAVWASAAMSAIVFGQLAMVAGGAK